MKEKKNNWEQHYQAIKILESPRTNIAAIKWRDDPDESKAFSVLLYIIHLFVLFLTLIKVSKAKKKKVIDIGAGPAVFRKQFINVGYSYRGIDIAPNIIQRNKKVFNSEEFFVHSVLKNPFPGSPYNLALSNMVLQHIPKHKQFLALSNIYANLYQKGSVIIIEGNDEDLYIEHYARTRFEWKTMAKQIGFSNIFELSIMCFPFARIMFYPISKICTQLITEYKKSTFINLLLWLNLPIEIILISVQFFWPKCIRFFSKLNHSQFLLVFTK